MSLFSSLVTVIGADQYCGGLSNYRHRDSLNATVFHIHANLWQHPSNSVEQQNQKECMLHASFSNSNPYFINQWRSEVFLYNFQILQKEATLRPIITTYFRYYVSREAGSSVVPRMALGLIPSRRAFPQSVSSSRSLELRQSIDPCLQSSSSLHVFYRE